MTAQELQKEFSRFLNGGGSDDFKEFAECTLDDHRTLQQSAFSLFMQCLHAWAKAYEEGERDHYFHRRHGIRQSAIYLNDPVGEWLSHQTFNLIIAGSIPAWVAIFYKDTQ